jgi:hypothetical protein
MVAVRHASTWKKSGNDRVVHEIIYYTADFRLVRDGFDLSKLVW